MRKTKTYMDKLMNDKEFCKKFDEEYQNICIGEQIARTRHRANLTQDTLVNRIKNGPFLVRIIHQISFPTGAPVSNSP